MHSGFGRNGLGLLILLLASLPTKAQEINRSTRLTEKNFSAIRDKVLLSRAEADWKKIPRKPDLGVAMKEAGMNSEALGVLIEQEVQDMIREREGAPGQTTPVDEVPAGAASLGQ